MPFDGVKNSSCQGSINQNYLTAYLPEVINSFHAGINCMESLWQYIISSQLKLK